MIICLSLKSGASYYTIGDSLKEVKSAVELGEEPIECWWYSAAGKKYIETFLFPNDGDAINCYYTESDVPHEEM